MPALYKPVSSLVNRVLTGLPGRRGRNLRPHAGVEDADHRFARRRLDGSARVHVRLPTIATLAPSLVRALPDASRSLASLLARLRSHPGPFALHETTNAARPYLLAGIASELAVPLVVVVATPDLAERTFTDLAYYLGVEEERTGTQSPWTLSLVRPRDESIGALESPSDRSARIALFADLLARKALVAIVPIAALRQYVMPPEVFAQTTFTVQAGTEFGFEDLQTRLHRSGYRRTDVVSAAGEFTVRGGIVDVFTPLAATPTRIELFGDEIESIRAFDLATQRSLGGADGAPTLPELIVHPWSELPRDERLRERVIAAIDGAPNVVSAARSYLASGADVPEAWLPLAFAQRATLLDYVPARSLLVLEEPAMLAVVERGFDDERARERNVLLGALANGELAVDEDAVGEAVLAEVVAPHPRLLDLAPSIARLSTLVMPGAIETAEPTPWLKPSLESFVLETRPVEHFNRQLTLFLEAVKEWVAAGETVALVASGASRLTEMLRAANLNVERSASMLKFRRDGPASFVGGGAGMTRGNTVFVDQGSIEAGFAIPDLGLRVLGDREIFGQPPKRVKLRAVKEGVPVTLADLKVGDYVVHSVHGIGQYIGLRTETILGTTCDYLDIKYAGTDRMLVPVHAMHMVGKYGSSENAPRLSKMGGVDWARQKTRVSEALAKIADGLVALYAERELAPGIAHDADTPWQAELEESFPYDTTVDQQKAIDDAKADMERTRPMDRLVCGDVGYGKTEVAVRAAFKAVAGKRQVAVLVPTTLLAAQHHRTLSGRFASFPLRIEELSRYKSKKEQQAILRDVAEGKVDVVVGTHRLLQKDVVFKNLGLVVVDEEQRFGVMHKERLKVLRASVDMLTLSATPIPRTLHMSLLGVRDLSLIQTPPKNRLAVKTIVVPAADAIVQQAIVNELDRGGQVYYLHNRVESIHAVAAALQKLVPKARIGVGHGQMAEGEIEPIMNRLIEGELDVLVATTIIENGIDIPNVNTIIVSDADRFGLAQLYQLRGRVGRSNHQAYAYLLYQPHKVLSEDAKARLEAIREFTHLGSGLQVAMRDLEIRGAGNLLGAAQSGFIGSVGFETYCELLAQAIADRKGSDARERAREAVIDVKLDAYIPNDYIPQVSQKIAVYQQLATARTEAEADEIAAGLRDRFGEMPQPLANLVEITKLRTVALRKNVTRVIISETRLTLGVGTGFAIDAAALPKLQSYTRNKFRFADGKILVDLPDQKPIESLPLLRALLAAL